VHRKARRPSFVQRPGVSIFEMGRAEEALASTVRASSIRNAAAANRVLSRSPRCHAPMSVSEPPNKSGHVARKACPTGPEGKALIIFRSPAYLIFCAAGAEETDLATWDVVSVASDIAEAGTALAGLILVYLGAVAVRYETLDSKAQSSARDVYRRHARRAFRGIVIALGAAAGALTAKLLNLEPYSTMIATMAALRSSCHFS
jgi:hypothetical protein